MGIWNKALLVRACMMMMALGSMLLITAQTTSANEGDNTAISPDFFREMRWRCIGPFRAGRTVAISGVIHQPNVFYMAAVNGGVWKTTDFGNTWTPDF